MKKISFIVGFAFFLSLMISMSAHALISSVTINFPPSGMETNDGTMDFNVTVVWTDPTNITNVTIHIDGVKAGVNSTINGSRTSVTTGDFLIKSVSLTSLAQGAHTIIAEARNSSGTVTPSSAVNSSSLSFVYDTVNTAPILELDRGIVAPFKVVTLDCSQTRGTTDASGTVNTSSFNLFVLDPDSVRTTSTPTTGIAEFSDDTLSIKGEYTAGCNVSDNAGNVGVTTTLFRVSDNDNEIREGDAQAKQFRRSSNRSLLYLGMGLLFLVLIFILLIVVVMYMSKKR